MLLLGIDLGTSSVKVSVVDAHAQKCLVSVQYPETETGIISEQPGWAEQDPMMWWDHVKSAILKAHAAKKYDPADIAAIGISYQMHGLVCVDKAQQLLRHSIIWCDSRAVEIGAKAFNAIGHSKSLQHMLNSPGNFTASKLAWVKENEPDIYERTDKIMLPGDFISMKFTGEITTSTSALSEGVFWDFKTNSLSKEVFDHFEFDKKIIPQVNKVFSAHGLLKADVAIALSLKAGIPVSYKAGDQPNNALSLNVLDPGEVAATAGTSGVIYGVSKHLTFDPLSRINTFAHVNHTDEQKRLGVLLCINGTGILNRWIRNISGDISYLQMNETAQKIAVGSKGLKILPFGNGAERMLENKMIGAHICNLDLNVHEAGHLFRAGQEAVAFAFRYGLDIMKENGFSAAVIKAGRANMFMSDLFGDCFVNALNIPVELYNVDGSVGAALGAGIGCGFYQNPKEAFRENEPLKVIEPDNKAAVYDELYGEWKELLNEQITKRSE